MDLGERVASWTAKDIKKIFTAASISIVQDKPWHKMAAGLDAFLAAVESEDVDGSMLKYVDKDFLVERAGIKHWAVQTGLLVFLKDLVADPALVLEQLAVAEGAARKTDKSALLTPPTTTAFNGEQDLTLVEDITLSAARPPIALDQTTLSAPTTNAKEFEDITAPAEQDVTVSKRQKRAIITSTKPLSTTPPPQLQPAAHLSRIGIDVDDMFFPVARVGERMPEDVEDLEFQFIGSQARPAVQQSVHRRMKYFLQAPETMLSNTSRGSVCIMPYKRSLKRQPSALLVTPHGPAVHRVLIAETVNGLQARYKEELEDDYTAYLARNPPQASDDDHAIEDDDDGETVYITDDSSDEASDMAEESKEEEDAILEADDVLDIINDKIAMFRERWQSKIPALTNSGKARAIWRKLKGSKAYCDICIEAANQNIARLQERMKKLEQHLLEAKHTDVDEVRKACAILQPTIADWEEQLWHISIWESCTPPDGPPLPPRRTPHHLSASTAATSTIGALLTSLGSQDRLPQNEESMEDLVQDAEPEDTAVTAANLATNRDELVAPDGADLDEFIDKTSDGDIEVLSLHGDHYRGNTTHDSDHLLMSSGRDQNNAIEIEDDADAEHVMAPRILTSTPKRKRGMQGIWSHAVHKVEELSSDEDELGALDSDPAEQRARKRTKVDQHQLHHIAASKPLEDITLDDVDDFITEKLVFDRDYHRLLVVLLRNETEEFRQYLHSILFAEDGTTVDQDFSHILADSIRDLVDWQEQEDRGVAMLRCARIAISWWLLDPSLMQLSADQHDWSAAGELVYDVKQHHVFVQQLASILRQHKVFASRRNDPSSPMLIGDSSASESANEVSSRRKGKTRKRILQESQEGIDSRAAAMKRQARFKMGKAHIKPEPEASQGAKRIEINPGREESDVPIFIDQRVASHLKPHQVNGVQFLWRELTANEKINGCLLAHDMGLGKTMQVLTTLLTIRQATQSKDESILLQLPKSLRARDVQSGNRSLRILVLCPPQMLSDWRREQRRWTGDGLGETYALSSDCLKTERVGMINLWDHDGGVLLMGYNLYASMYKTAQKLHDGNPVDSELTLAMDILLRRTDIVVADEAHTFKTATSNVHKAVMALSAKSRIAMSGTPLSNKIDEVYEILSWASPGFLGDRREFNSHFGNPIKEGLYADSTNYQRRKAYKKLAVLKHDIEPKYDRCTVEVLRGSLPSKVEYILSVGLSPIQQYVYSKFIRALGGAPEAEHVSQVQMFSWLNGLTILLNHPWAFRKKLMQKQKARTKSKAKQKGANQTLDADTPDTTEIEEAGATSDDTLGDVMDVNSVIHGLSENVREEIVGCITDDLNAQLSAKTSLFMDILKRCLARQDKVLVFSTTIPTLDYMEEMLNSKHLRVGRIDGSINAESRLKLIKRMSTGEPNELDILLISTKAGGVGLNIQAANRVFILDFGFNPSHELQAIGRAYRIGQKKPVKVYRFVTDGTFETNLDNRAIFKKALAQRVVDKKKPQRSAMSNVGEWLYDPKEPKEEDISGWMGHDPDVLDSIIAAQLSGVDANKHKIFAIKTTETLEEADKDPELDEQEKKEVAEEIAEGRRLRSHNKNSPSKSRVITSPAKPAMPVLAEDRSMH